ncbi:hypothetical protein PspLS_11744 [Pyricularia sp. CBS 133598]|nr:hypothetical protein PspLS_11744 [Pyricularia sp. CBS 133598]
MSGMPLSIRWATAFSVLPPGTQTSSRKILTGLSLSLASMPEPKQDCTTKLLAVSVLMPRASAAETRDSIRYRRDHPEHGRDHLDAVLGDGVCAGEEGRGALAADDGQVGHGAHDRRAAGQPGLQLGDRDAGTHGDDGRPRRARLEQRLQRAGDLPAHLRYLLGAGADEDDVRVAAAAVGCPDAWVQVVGRREGFGVLLTQLLRMLRPPGRDGDGACVFPFGLGRVDAADDGSGEVPTADERSLIRFPYHGPQACRPIWLSKVGNGIPLVDHGTFIASNVTSLWQMHPVIYAVESRPFAETVANVEDALMRSSAGHVDKSAAARR